MKRRSFVVGAVGVAAGLPQRAAAAGPVEIPGWRRGTFLGDDGVTRTYYCGGEKGPPVMVLHEMLGLTPDDIDFGERLASHGFTVYMPLMFGTANHEPKGLSAAALALKVCVSHEFAVFRAHRSSPIAQSLRVLGRMMFEHHGGRGIGVIGLCLTGNFALAMMADEHLVAPVLSEPALPFGLTRACHRALHINEDELQCVKRRAAEGIVYLGFRFEGDCISPFQRFDHLKEELGPAFDRNDLKPTMRGSHAVFTTHYKANEEVTRPAFERLVGYLQERLTGAA
jgi:dienelactone hydrolase